MKNQILSCLLLLIYNIAFPQTKGKVLSSETNEPIAYTNIWVENEKIGTTSDKTGFFELEQNCTNKTLVVSAIGFKSQRVKVEEGFLTILLVPKNYFIPEVIVKPTKQKELVIADYKKSEIDDYTGTVGPQIDARFFPYRIEYQDTPIISSIKIRTYSLWPSFFRLHIMEADSLGQPGKDILKDNLLVKVKKGRGNVEITNFNNTTIKFPDTGLFIAVEFLIVKENSKKLPCKNLDTNQKIYKIVYMPFIGLQTTTETTNEWSYSGGKWCNNQIGSTIRKTHKTNFSYRLAMKVTLSD